MIDVSVVVPLYNEQDNVARLCAATHEALAGMRRTYEIVLVDDGSSDDTVAAAGAIARSDSRVRLVVLARNAGQTAAMAAGMAHARGQYLVTMDGDLQNDPRDVFALLERFFTEPDRESIGLLIGHRVRRRDSRTRRFASRFANGLRSRVLHDETPDTGCGIKVVRRSVFLELPYFDHMHRFLPALTQRAGYRVLSVPVHHRPRIHAKAHYGTLDRAWGGVVDLVGVAWLMRRERRVHSKEERQ